MGSLRTFRLYCACAKYVLGLCSQFIHSVVSNDFVSSHGRLQSGCADAQADLGLRCTHMPEDMFVHGAAHIEMRLEFQT